jgi:hypothetical protein
MAKLTTTGVDLVRALISGSFTGTGQSAGGPMTDQNTRTFNAALWGTFVGTAQLERSFDGGTTWIVCGKDSSGTPAAYTGVVSLTLTEPERNVQYRWNCTNYVSGTINYRLSH